MRYLINLFPAKEQNTVDKIIYFAFHYLRYILVITQFVVICVFFYRFKVDQEIVDLKDGLKQKQQIVNATEQLINEVKVISNKVGNIQTVFAEQTTTQNLYSYFFDRLPSSLIVNNFRMSEGSLEIEGVTDDSNSVKLFYESLKSENRFTSIELRNVRKTDEGYTFSLRLLNFKASTP